MHYAANRNVIGQNTSIIKIQIANLKKYTLRQINSVSQALKI